jgi:hypothetical protein
MVCWNSTDNLSEINIEQSFDREDGDDIFHRNVSWIWTDYMALHPRIYKPFNTTAMETWNPVNNLFVGVEQLTDM